VQRVIVSPALPVVFGPASTGCSSCGGYGINSYGY
jgi:hypothetical protein